MARKTDTRKTRETFIIITNGKKSEQNYFNLLKSYKSIYEVKVLFKNAAPTGLVHEAEQYTRDANQVWCVFDIDNTYSENQLIPAIREAKKNGIKIAYSNAAFEVWLISHFQKCNKYLNTTQLIDILNDYLKSQGCKFTYDKSDDDTLKNYFVPNYNIAINNAKIVYQKRVKEFREQFNEAKDLPIWEWNSSTTIYLLVEAMKLSSH